MQSRRLEIIRQTKLDLALWITAGLATCRRPATAQLLARYAAAQLEAAALIPHSNDSAANKPCISLLRAELRKARGSSTESIVILARVSRAMLTLLADGAPGNENGATRDVTVARLIRQEVQAARVLAEMRRGKFAA